MSRGIDRPYQAQCLLYRTPHQFFLIRWVSSNCIHAFHAVLVSVQSKTPGNSSRALARLPYALRIPLPLHLLSLSNSRPSLELIRPALLLRPGVVVSVGVLFEDLEVGVVLSSYQPCQPHLPVTHFSLPTPSDSKRRSTLALQP